MWGSVGVCILLWVCDGEQLSEHLLTALGRTAGDDKEPWQIHTLTTIYNLNSSHILYISASSRALALASITDITGGLELTRTELWISNSNVSQMSIGLYTSLCPVSVLDCSRLKLQFSLIALWKDYFAILGCLQNTACSCGKSLFHLLYYVAVGYITATLPVCSGLEDNRCSPQGENVFPPKRVAINIDLIYTKMYTCGILKGI